MSYKLRSKFARWSLHLISRGTAQLISYTALFYRVCSIQLYTETASQFCRVTYYWSLSGILWVPTFLSLQFIQNFFDYFLSKVGLFSTKLSLISLNQVMYFTSRMNQDDAKLALHCSFSRNQVINFCTSTWG